MVTSPTPQICWSSPRELGSGIDHYAMTIDGVLNRDHISPGTDGSNCTTPTAALAAGKHTQSITAYDRAGNSTVATDGCAPFVVDINPPTSFALVSPVGADNNVVVVNTLTPT